MNNLLTGIFFNHSIIIAVVIACIRFKKIKSVYYPFLWVLFLGLLNESLSVFLIHHQRSNSANSNVYVLLEYLLILWQFFKWNDHAKRRYILLGFIGLAVWCTDNALLHQLTNNNSVFRAFGSLIIAFLSIDQLSKLLFFGDGPLWKNPIFIICTAFVFYFGFKAFVEVFNIFREVFNAPFLRNIWIILYFVNATANLLYAIALLWIPGKPKFTLRY